MRRRMTLLITAAIMAMSMSLAAAGAALADPPLPGGCSKEQGTINCVQEEEGKNDKFTQEQTTTQKGSFQSSHDPVTTEECQQDGQTRDKCPSGQFK
jgi:hypothetical protein